MKPISSIAIYLAVVFSNSMGFCQKEFVEQKDLEFLTRQPEIGTIIKNVKAFDENGELFQLNRSRGKHTVLIFGCLT